MKSAVAPSVVHDNDSFSFGAAETSTGSVPLDDVATAEDAPLPPANGTEAVLSNAVKRIASRMKDPPPLSRDELVERMCLHSPGLVEDLYSGALRAIQAEDTRESRLDGKAQGLLVTSGLSLTVAFSFGGIILQHPEYLTALERHVGGWLPIAVVVVYAVALIGGLSASVYAVRSLFVSGKYRTTSDHDALDHPELLAADEEFSAEIKTNANAEPRPPVDYKRANERAQLRYRRYITPHYWQIWQHHRDIHEKKATLIGRGQHLFVVFLVSLLLIALTMGASALMRVEAPNPPPQVGASQ